MKILITYCESAIVFHDGANAYVYKFKKIIELCNSNFRGREGLKYWNRCAKEEGKPTPFWIEVDDISVKSLKRGIPEIFL